MDSLKQLEIALANPNITRRDLLKMAAASAACGATQLSGIRLQAKDFESPVPGSEKLTAYLNGSQVLLRWNNIDAITYRANPLQKYPYFYPLAGPVTGLSLTTESSLPYPHHRGLWLGCDPVNGGDYWSDGPLERGRIQSVELKLGETTPTSAVITDRCSWIRPGAPSPLQDKRKFTISFPSDRIRLIDVELQLKANEDITIKGAKHSFFALRCAPDISPMYGGVLMNSKGGTGAKGTYGKPASWCGFHGKRAFRPEVVEGIAIMDHPENPWAPCPWFTREYGHLSPSPFNFLKTPWKLPKGESIRLKYRVVLHSGDPKEAGLDKLFEEWIAA